MTSGGNGLLQHISQSHAMNEVQQASDDPLEFNPNLWIEQVAFRDSFKNCWSESETARARLACIGPEMAYQEEVIRRTSDGLRARLSQDEWRMLEEDIRSLPSADDGTCATETSPSESDADGAQFCRLYRTALLANYLDVQLALQSNFNKE